MKDPYCRRDWKDLIRDVTFCRKYQAFAACPYTIHDDLKEML